MTHFENIFPGSTKLKIVRKKITFFNNAIQSYQQYSKSSYQDKLKLFKEKFQIKKKTKTNKQFSLSYKVFVHKKLSLLLPAFTYSHLYEPIFFCQNLFSLVTTCFYLHALIFISKNLFLFMIICENLFLSMIICENL